MTVDIAYTTHAGVRVKRKTRPSYWKGVHINRPTHKIYASCPHKHVSERRAVLCSVEGFQMRRITPEECTSVVIRQAGSFTFEADEVAVICNDLGIEPGVLTDDDIVNWVINTVNKEFDSRLNAPAEIPDEVTRNG